MSTSLGDRVSGTPQTDAAIDERLGRLPVGARAPSFVVTDDLDLDAVPFTRFAARVFDEGYSHLASRRWSLASNDVAPLLPHASLTSDCRSWSYVLIDLELEVGAPCIAYVYVGDGGVWARFAAHDRGLLTVAEQWLREKLPEVQPTEDRRVPIRFWSLGGRGAGVVTRRLTVPAWAEVAENYPRSVRDRLGTLLRDDFRPSAAGQLLLWHGAPGTGKTHALRALAWEWRSWCDVHYVTDPDDFFGRSSYLLDVLLREADDEDDDDDDADDEREGAGEAARRWRLLVLEDAGEFLVADAKAQTGQALSRFLNVVDGIIGQGLRVFVLVTTNEDLRRLHPAASRPGRCAANVKFSAFPPDEAAEWLARRDRTERRREATLAQLYAGAAGAEEPASAPFGFSASSA